MYIKSINWKLNFRSFSVKWKLFKNKINILTTIVKASRYLMLNCSKKGVFASFLLKILFLADMLNWSPSLREIYNESCSFSSDTAEALMPFIPSSQECKLLKLNWPELRFCLCPFVLFKAFLIPCTKSLLPGACNSNNHDVASREHVDIMLTCRH